MSLNPFATPPGLTPPPPPRSTQPSQAHVARKTLAVAVHDLTQSFLRTPSAAPPTPPPPPPPLPGGRRSQPEIGGGQFGARRSPTRTAPKTSADTPPAATPDEVADLVDAAEDAAASMSDPGLICPGGGSPLYGHCVTKQIIPTHTDPSTPDALLTVDDVLDDTADVLTTQASKPGVSKLLVGAGIVLAGIVVIRLIK